MHVHAYSFDKATVDELKFSGNKDFYGIQGSMSKEEHFKDSYERFRHKLAFQMTDKRY